ncbi:MAG: hypothetical protein OXC71_00140 [Chloroflexi bacterium]|nr:hypothetical protein [Chloroflexota bacterium]
MGLTRTAGRRIRGLTLLLAITAFSMVGCIRYELGFTVNADGSGAMSVLIAISDQFSAMTGTTTEDALGIDPATLPGASVEEYNQDGYSGVQLSIPFANLQQLGLFMGSSQSDSLTSDFDLRPDGTGGWSFSTVLLPAADAAGEQAAGAEALPPELLQGAFARVRVQLPGEVAEHNADRIEDGAFIWDIDFTATEPRQLTASTTGAAEAGAPEKPKSGPGVLAGADSGTNTLGVIALGLAAVLTVAGGVAVRRRSRA